jgi:hypothetical protein
MRGGEGGFKHDSDPVPVLKDLQHLITLAIDDRNLAGGGNGKGRLVAP